MRKYTKEIINNFDLKKNVPIDCRYWIGSLAELDDKIPLPLRYEGLQFFVSNDTPDVDVNAHRGFVYIFETDLSTPIKLIDMVLRYEVNGLDIRYSSSIWVYYVDGDKKYSEQNIKNILDKESHKRLGTVISIPKLNLSVMWDGNDWVKFSGEITAPNGIGISDDEIPKSFVKNGDFFWDGDTKKVVDINASGVVRLAPIVESTTITENWNEPTTKREDAYLSENGILFHAIGGDGSVGKSARRIYRVGKKLKVIKNKKLLEGKVRADHGFNTHNIRCQFAFTDSDGIYSVIDLEIGKIDLNSIYVYSCMEVTGDLIITSDF